MIKDVDNLVEEGEGYMVHFTRNVESTTSILKNGFIPVPQPTRVWRELFKSIGKETPEIGTGMVSFTTVNQGESINDHISKNGFGEFGIVVNYNWAIDNGVKPVVYIDSQGTVFSALQALLKNSLPHPNYQIFLKGKFQDMNDPRTQGVLEDWVLSSPHLDASYTNPLYSHLIELLKYVETERNKSEREHRIRVSRNKTIMSTNYNTKDYINTCSALVNSEIALDLTVKIPINQVLFILCPKLQETFLKKAFEYTEFESVAIVTY